MLSSNKKLSIMYENTRYIKLSGPEESQKKLFNLQSDSDILMVVCEDEYDILQSLYEESGKKEFLPSSIVSQDCDNLIYENFPTQEYKWGLYVKEIVLSNFNKNYPFVIRKDKEIYVPIYFIRSFTRLDLEEYFYINLNDNSKLRLISDADFEIFQKIFDSVLYQPRYIHPFSECLYINHTIDNDSQNYIKLTCLSQIEIELLNNL